MRTQGGSKFQLEMMNSHNYSLKDTDLALRTAGGEGEPSPLLVNRVPVEIVPGIGKRVPGWGTLFRLEGAWHHLLT